MINVSRKIKIKGKTKMWKETWNKAYRESDCYWGLNPNPKIVNFVKHIPSGKILDLGSGEGRNALYLAKKGYQVVCVDNSHAGISKCKEKADVLDVKAECRTLDIRDFTASDAEFSCIICHASLPFLKRSEADNIIACTKKWLCPKGVAFVSVFTTDDPLYKTYLEEGLEEIEQYTTVMCKNKEIK